MLQSYYCLFSGIQAGRQVAEAVSQPRFGREQPYIFQQTAPRALDISLPLILMHDCKGGDGYLLARCQG